MVNAMKGKCKERNMRGLENTRNVNFKNRKGKERKTQGKKSKEGHCKEQNMQGLENVGNEHARN